MIFSLIDIFCHVLTHLQMSIILMCCLCNYIVLKKYTPLGETARKLETIWSTFGLHL